MSLTVVASLISLTSFHLTEIVPWLARSPQGLLSHPVRVARHPTSVHRGIERRPASARAPLTIPYRQTAAATTAGAEASTVGTRTFLKPQNVR